MKLPLALLVLLSLQSALTASPQRPTLLPGQSNWTPPLEDGPMATSDMAANSAQGLVDFLTAPGVVTTNASFQGATVAGGTFSGGLAAFGIESGVVLSTGDIASIAGPLNQYPLASTNNGTPGSHGIATCDAAILEFTVQSPTPDIISLQVVFASEEYSEWLNYDDVFSCLVNGVERAKVPGANAPVSVANVNYFANSQYFIENSCSELGFSYPCLNIPTEMDGFTTLLTVTAPIAAGSNSIQLSVADFGDCIGDSVVLLREGSLMVGTPIPEFTLPTPCGQVLSVREGELLEFEVSAFARNGQVNQDASIDLLQTSGVLVGATFDPPLGTPGQPAVTHVSWTPSAADTGLQVVRFRATDQLGSTSDCEFQILVEPTPPFVPCEERLAASSEQALDRQGQQVDYSDGRSILGSPERSGSGMVTIHEEIGGVWTQVADILHPAPSGTNDRFGWSVAIDGDWAVVGAPFEGTPQAFNGPGATYVFRRDANGSWALWQQLLRSGTQTQDDRFGFSVDVTGDFLAVGAFGDSQGGANNGAVYVYRLVNGSTWVFEDKLLATPLQNQQTIRLGTGVAIDGGTVISGAPYEDINGLQSAGAAYVFERQTNSTWVQSARLTTPTLASGTFFGVTVDAFGSRVIAGAEGVGGVGAAFVHERNLGGGWGLEGTLTPQVPSQNLTFGQGVRLYGGRAAVNARNAIVQGQPVAGAVEIFELDTSLNWTYARTLTKITPAAFDAFGTGIGLGDGVAIVGCPGDDASGLIDAGAAYLFDLGIADCNSNGTADSCDLALGTSQDCNGNLVPDECDLAAGLADCNANGVLDSCEIQSGSASDCNGNGIPDSCDIAAGFATDCDGNGVPDSCDIASDPSLDCNGDTVIDSCQLATLDCNGNGQLDPCETAADPSIDLNSNSIPDSCEPVGVPYCTPNAPNSEFTGGGKMSAIGTADVVANDVRIFASDLPTNAFGFFIASRSPGFVPFAGGSQGILCLGGTIGRYQGQIQSSGTSNAFSIQIDNRSIPFPNSLGYTSVAPGERWHFQAWYRDSLGGTATSNLTESLFIQY